MKKVIITVLAVAAIAFACNKAMKDKPLTPDSEVKITTNTSSGQNRTFPSASELQTYFDIHNDFMTDMIEGNNPSQTDLELTNSVKPFVGFQASANFTDNDFNTIMLNQISEYAELDGSNYIAKLNANNIITSAEKTVLNEISTNMDDANYDDLTAFLADLDEYSGTASYNALPDSSKQLVDYFVAVYKNSAELYHPYAMASAKTAGAACNKCIRDNIRAILLGDAGGALAGLGACLAFPPACAVLAPALIALGSGAALLYRCRGKC